MLPPTTTKRPKVRLIRFCKLCNVQLEPEDGKRGAPNLCCPDCEPLADTLYMRNYMRAYRSRVPMQP